MIYEEELIESLQETNMSEEGKMRTKAVSHKVFMILLLNNSNIFTTLNIFISLYDSLSHLILRLVDFLLQSA